MKVLVALFFSVISIFSPLKDVPFSAVESAFQQGDAARLVAISNEKVILTLPGKEGVFSHSQMEQILKTFFDQYPPKSFSFQFKGRDGSNHSFGLGFYESKENFRVSIKFSKHKENYKIESISIEIR
jgi:hypothetical protein